MSSTRAWSAVLAAVAVLVLAACSGMRSATAPLPDDPDAVVISYTGYFGQADIVDVMVTADGRVFRATQKQSGPSMTVAGFAFLYPVSWETFEVAPQTINQAFAMAEGMGLFRDVADPMEITDTSGTRVRFVTAADEFSSSFAALGSGDESGIRAAAEAYGVALGQLLADRALGEIRPFESEQWRVEVRDIDPMQTLDPWPLETPPEPGCVALDPADFPRGLPGAYLDDRPRGGGNVVSIDVVFPWTPCP